MCGGGGDGGAQAEADRVRREQELKDYQIAQDKAKINALFGVTDYDYTGVKPRAPGYAVAEAEMLKSKEAAERVAAGDAPPRNYMNSDYNQSEEEGMSWQQLYERQKAELEANYPTSAYDANAVAAQAADSFSTREASLAKIYDDIFKNYNYEQDRQYLRKKASVETMLSGRGLSRSSVGQSVFNRLDELRDTNTTRFERDATAAVNKIRASDRTVLDDLVRSIDAGGDFSSAKSSALSKMDTNVKDSVREANAADLTQLFKGMEEIYGQKQYVDSYDQGQRYGSTNLTTPGTSVRGNSGTVITYG